MAPIAELERAPVHDLREVEPPSLTAAVGAPGAAALLCCLVLAALTLIQAAVRRCRRRNGTLTRDDLPGAMELPLIGHLHHLLWRGGPMQVVPLLEDWVERYGTCFRFTVRAGVPGVAVADPDDVMAVLKARPSTFRREETSSALIKAQSGFGGLFTAEGAEWRRQRRLISPHLNRPNVRQMVQELCRVANKLCRKWECHAVNGSGFSVLDDLHLFAVDSNYVAVMGSDIDTLGGASIGQDALYVMHAVHKAVQSPIYLLLNGHKIKAAIARAGQFVADIVDAAVQAQSQQQCAAEQRTSSAAAPCSTTSETTPANSVSGGAACGALLRAAVWTGLSGAASDGTAVGGTASSSDSEARADLVDSMGLVLFAGFDTVGATLGWALYYIAVSADVQCAIRSEVADVLGAGTHNDTSAILAWQQVEQLHLLDAVVREAMALHNTTVAGVSITAGTPVYALVRHAARSEAHFTRARDFWPQRWLITAGMAPAPDGFKHANVVSAFGYGPRGCPGQLVALAQLKVALAMLVHNFVITPAPGQDKPQERHWNSTSPDDLRLVLQPTASDSANGR